MFTLPLLAPPCAGSGSEQQTIAMTLNLKAAVLDVDSDFLTKQAPPN